MGYEISIPETGKYIMVRIAGQMDRDLARQITKEVTRQDAEPGIRNHLVDVREAPLIEGDFAKHQFAYKDLGEIQFDKRGRVAILVDPTERAYDFFETVARNAGYDMRLFTQQDAAIAWLEEC